MHPKKQAWIRALEAKINDDKTFGCVIYVPEDTERGLPADVIMISFVVKFVEKTKAGDEVSFSRPMLLPQITGYTSYIVNLIYEFTVNRKGTLEFINDPLDLQLKTGIFRRKLNEWNN